MGKLYEESWDQKWQKRNNYRQIPEGVPVQVQGCTGTAHQRPTCTGTGQQNATCNGIGVPKMPRMCSFCVINLKFILH